MTSGLLAVQAANEATGAQRSIVITKDGVSASGGANTNAPANQTAVTPPKSIEELAGTAPHTDEHPAVQAPTAPQVDLQPMVQAMQLMIDQQKLALQSMEKARNDSIENARRTAESMGDKVGKLEESLQTQRTHEAETINRMNRLVIGVAAGFAGTGFVVMVLTAWFFMRTMNRVAEINANVQSQLLALPHSQPPLVGEGGSMQPGNQRLLGALEQLEKRIRDLEHTSTAPTTGQVGSGRSENSAGGDEPSLGVDTDFVEVDDDDAESIGALMARGQTLLSLDDAEQALVCFDAVIKQDAHNAEALLKKGTALERLRRMQEALDAYDAALQEDNSLTMAYLAKGGICNRMERYAEALECYERALRVQQEGAI